MTTKYKWSQRGEDRLISRELIDRLIAMKHCTLLSVKNYKCGDLDGYSLVKGKEKFCHNPLFLNCPAFNQYMNHEMKKNRRNVKNNMEKNINN